MRLLILGGLVAWMVSACGGAQESAPAPETPRAEAKSSESGTPDEAADAGEGVASVRIPKRCSKRKQRGECLPPVVWVNKLCNDVYPDVALHMFKPGTPWQRFYMRARAEPFNASGGASLLGDKLEMGEEVIALRRRANDGGIQIGDQSGYDVLRWNGACATIHDGDFSTAPPREVRHSRVEWRKLSVDMRNALEAEPEIQATYEERRRHCRGASLGQVTADCEKFDKRLVEEVVRHVRTGAALPGPVKAP
jgi:hypothetical protein